MFSSTKITDSPRTVKIGLHSDKHFDTFNDTTFGVNRTITSPKITSTPIRLDMYATPPKPHVLTTRRYSLSDMATPPRINRRDPIHRSGFQNNISGPLLASTKFNVNVSTYEETKSPGLARRIVQYNQEAERERTRPATHQAKYGSPGLFPIVHLFKKSPPVLEQKPKRVKVRISSPGYTSSQSEEYKLKLLEGVVRPRGANNFSHGLQQKPEANASTRSVLDALKEISRKRIHANEEYGIDEDSGKRQRTDFLNGEDSNKRTRDDTSPLQDSPTSPSKPVSKRVCMYDEYAASCSSTVYASKKSDWPGSKRKSISTSTLTENPKEIKQVKLINAETQTTSEEKVESSTELVTLTDTPQDTTQTEEEEPSTRRESPLKVFDDAPLERIRKNRLAALMGSLTGKDPVLTPKPTFSSILNGSTIESDTHTTKESDKTERPLTSILTTNKTTPKTDKHVHFEIPESTRSAGSSESFTIPTPNTNTSISSNSRLSLQTKTASSTPAPPSSPVSSKPPDAVGTFDFGSSSNSSTSLAPTVSSDDTAKSSDSNQNISSPVPALISASKSPQFTFGNPTSSTIAPLTAISTFGTSTSTLSPTNIAKPGGFKFNLSPQKTGHTKTASSVPTLTNSSIQGAGIAFGNANSTASSILPIDSKAIVTVATTTSTGLTFGTTTTASSTGPLSSSSASPFKLGDFNSEMNTKPQVETAGLMSKNETVNTIVSPTFSFGGTAKNSPGTNISLGGSTDKQSPRFSFETVKSTTGPASTISSPKFNFSAPKSTLPSTVSTTVSNAIGFGTTVSTSATTKSSNLFGAVSNTSNVLGTSSGGAFGTTTGVTTTTTTANAGFGTSSNATSFGNTSGGFGISTTSSGFQSNGFGLTTSNSFGISTSSSGFGATTTSCVFGTTTSSNGFGATTTASGFGAMTTSSGFGAPISSSGFGTATTASGFGAPTTSAGFGSATTSSGFGASITSSGLVVTTTSSGFGASTTSNGFSATGFGTKTTLPPTFGASNNPSGFGGFGTTNATSGGFGPTDAKSGVFGTSSASIFGGNKAVSNFTPSTTAAPTGFGNPSLTSSPFNNTVVPAFGNQNNASSPFGATTTSFNTNSSFNAPTTTSASVFGGATGFGTPTNNSTNIFGGAATTQAAGFGGNSMFSKTSSISPFGNTKTTTTNSTAVFSFGAKTTTASGNGFGVNPTPGNGFGSTTAASAAPFGGNTFGGSNNNFGGSNAFGSSNVPNFGATTTQSTSFGAQSSGFGAPTQSFGTENKPAFVNTTTPAFGTNTVAPVFGTPASSTTFGTSINTTTTFGSASVNNPAFGKSHSNAFGAGAPSNFGSTSGNFGSNQTQASGMFGSNTAAANSPAVFNFGSGAAKPGPFAFGGGSVSASGDQPKPSFNFTGGNAAGPTFGGSNPSFSAAAVAPTFGSANTPQFGAQQATAPGMFNIGAGSPSARNNRPMIRAKRKTNL